MKNYKLNVYGLKYNTILLDSKVWYNPIDLKRRVREKRPTHHEDYPTSRPICLIKINTIRSELLQVMYV